MQERDYYKALILGASGKGKTYTFRTLDPKTTGFINVEDKPLPFKNNFKYHSRCTNIGEVGKAMVSYSENDEIELIVIDSLSAYMDMLLAVSRSTKKGYEIWNYYNESIGKFLKYVKSIQKEVLVTGHYEWVQDEGGAKEMRAKVKGKEWEGVLEKEFTIVLYADSTFDGKKPTYSLNTVMEKSSAKCPPDIFGGEVYSIPNDGKFIFDSILKFVK